MRNPITAALLLALTAAPLAAQERQEMGNEPPTLTDAKGTDERVRAFANQMIEAHTAINESAGELVTELGVTPEAHEISRSIHDGQEASRERLDDLSGAEFDRAYIANEVTYHEAVIDAVDNVLIPAAQNEQLKQTLIDVRPAFVAHLEQARSIREYLMDEKM